MKTMTTEVIKPIACKPTAQIMRYLDSAQSSSMSSYSYMENYYQNRATDRIDVERCNAPIADRFADSESQSYSQSLNSYQESFNQIQNNFIRVNDRQRFEMNEKFDKYNDENVERNERSNDVVVSSPTNMDSNDGCFDYPF